MKHNRYFLISIFISLSFFTVSCGSYMTLTQGDLNFFQDQNKIKLAYDYSELKILDYKTENEFLDSMVKIISNNKDTQLAEAWKKKWFRERKEMLHLTFEQELNNILYKINLSVDTGYNDAKYLLTMKVIYINPGTITEDFSGRPSIMADFIFSEREHPEKVLAKIEGENIEGTNYISTGSYEHQTTSINGRLKTYTVQNTKRISDFNTGLRLQPLYKSWGILLGRYLKSNL